MNTLVSPFVQAIRSSIGLRPNGVKLSKSWKAVKPVSAASYRDKPNICAATRQARRLRSSLMPAQSGASWLNAIGFQPVLLFAAYEN
jgi:hypothetical protein